MQLSILHHPISTGMRTASEWPGMSAWPAHLLLLPEVFREGVEERQQSCGWDKRRGCELIWADGVAGLVFEGVRQRDADAGIGAQLRLEPTQQQLDGVEADLRTRFRSRHEEAV